MKRKLLCLLLSILVTFNIIGCAKEEAEVQPEIMGYTKDAKILVDSVENNTSPTDKISDDQSNVVDWDAGHTEGWDEEREADELKEQGIAEGDVITITYCDRSVTPYRSFHFELNGKSKTIDYLVYRGSTIEDAEKDYNKQQGTCENIDDLVIKYLKLAYDNNLMQTSQAQICDLFCYTLADYCTKDLDSTYAVLEDESLRRSLQSYDTDKNDFLTYKEYCLGVFNSLSNQLFMLNQSETTSDEVLLKYRASEAIDSCLQSEFYMSSDNEMRNEILLSEIEDLKTDGLIIDYVVEVDSIVVTYTDKTTESFDLLDTN